MGNGSFSIVACLTHALFSPLVVDAVFARATPRFSAGFVLTKALSSAFSLVTNLLVSAVAFLPQLEPNSF